MKKHLFSLVLVALLAAAGCNGDKPLSGNNYINEWMYANMDFYYFWTDEMPRKPKTNQDPAAFYEQLLFSGDRFSFIYPNYEELINLLNGITLESGFEFKLYEVANSEVIMQLVYIKPGSPADDLGLMRGDVITAINGQIFTTSNYRDVLATMNSTYTMTWRRYNEDLEQFENQENLNLTPVVFSENPILLDSIYDLDGTKVGYLIYNFFSPGPTESSVEYDLQVDDVFAEFKSEGIEELIVDLRFNSGGSETSFLNLASLLAKEENTGDLMYTKSYNERVTQLILNDPDAGEEFLNADFLVKASNIGDQLTSGKVHFLVTDRTASASEVVINAIKPYMDVFLIGETTEGKDVGSVTIFERDNPRNAWAIQPIIVKLVNAEGEDYPNGFSPDVAINDDFEVLTPLGDINEPLLSAALTEIGGVVARQDIKHRPMWRKPIMESIERKKWAGKILMNPQPGLVIELPE